MELLRLKEGGADTNTGIITTEVSRLQDLLSSAPGPYTIQRPGDSCLVAVYAMRLGAPSMPARAFRSPVREEGSSKVCSMFEVTRRGLPISLPSDLDMPLS